ncbi:MAG TPA: hypothetical protein VGI64_03050 [Streptosporangiaceae bacterium]|jgi:hypothetical protein
MTHSSSHDLGAIGQRILAGGQLSPAERQAGFSVLASDADQQAGAGAVWLVEEGHPEAAEYALQFEQIGPWQYLGWSGGSARGLSLNGRPSAASAPHHAVELLTSGSARSRSDRTRQPGGQRQLTDSVGWVSCAGFRLATEAVTLQAGERRISVPDHGYVIVAWRSPARLSRPPITALRADGSALTTIGPDEHLDSLTWQGILTALDDEPPASQPDQLPG